MRTSPFPHGWATDVFAPGTYSELVASFPPPFLAHYQVPGHNLYGEGPGVKYALTEYTDPDTYWQFMYKCPRWAEFRDSVCSTGFHHYIVDTMAKQGIKIQPGKWHVTVEFSYLPGDSGHVPHHVDISTKLLSMVIPMCDYGEWPPEWDGSTDMQIADPDAKPEREVTPEGVALKVFQAYPFAPNTCNIHLRVPDVAWHRVRCHGPAYAVRKSVTLNLMHHVNLSR